MTPKVVDISSNNNLSDTQKLDLIYEAALGIVGENNVENALLIITSASIDAARHLGQDLNIQVGGNFDTIHHFFANAYVMTALVPDGQSNFAGIVQLFLNIQGYIHEINHGGGLNFRKNPLSKADEKANKLGIEFGRALNNWLYFHHMAKTFSPERMDLNHSYKYVLDNPNPPKPSSVIK